MRRIRRHHDGLPHLTPSWYRRLLIPIPVLLMMIVGLLFFWFLYRPASNPAFPTTNSTVNSTVPFATLTVQLSRVRRWLNDYGPGFISDPKDPKHPYEQNLWYRYARHSADNNTNCYVCSRMPHSSAAPRVSIEPLTHPQSTCVLHMVAGENKSTGYFDPSEPYNFSNINSCLIKGNHCETSTCSPHLGDHPWVMAVPARNDTLTQVAVSMFPTMLNFLSVTISMAPCS